MIPSFKQVPEKVQLVVFKAPGYGKYAIRPQISQACRDTLHIAAVSTQARKEIEFAIAKSTTLLLDLRPPEFKHPSISGIASIGQPGHILLTNSRKAEIVDNVTVVRHPSFRWRKAKLLFEVRIFIDLKKDESKISTACTFAMGWVDPKFFQEEDTDVPEALAYLRNTLQQRLAARFSDGAFGNTMTAEKLWALRDTFDTDYLVPSEIEWEDGVVKHRIAHRSQATWMFEKRHEFILYCS